VSRAVGLKICGLTRAEDLRACAELGVDAVGLNFWPGSKRALDLDGGRELVASLPGSGPTRVGVFVDAPLARVEAAIDACDLELIQPHGDAPVEPYAELAAKWGLGWIWVLRGTPELDTLRLPEPRPRWILLDAAVEGYGGAGRRTDWAWAAEAVDALAPIAVWLAGGITPDNVAEALERVRPAGVDVASGAELPGARRGEKDREALAALIRACRAAPPRP
jgi:phosphoribosylanthranilate isomerase